MERDEPTRPFGELPVRASEVRPPRIPEIIEVDDTNNYREAYENPRSAPRVPSRVRTAAILFVATCLSTWIVGGLAYAVPLMLILFAHEMGHYLQAKRYGVPATLPFFIPMPFTPFGTMGAVIVQGAGYADRKALFDIAISGPLAGLVVALPITYWGLQHAEIIPPEKIHPNQATFGDPLILQWMIEAVHGPLAPGEEVGGRMLFAGWVGIFITALNLIPIGQLDGGHILYTLIGKRAHTVAIGLLFVAVGYMIYMQYPAYGLFVILLFLMGPKHPPTANDRIPLGPGRIILGWLTLAFIVVGFTPTPIVTEDMRPQRKQQAVEPIVVEHRVGSPVVGGPESAPSGTSEAPDDVSPRRPNPAAAALRDVPVGMDSHRLGKVFGNDLSRRAHFPHRVEVAER